MIDNLTAVRTTGLSTPDIHLIEQTEYRAYDSLLAVAFCVCLVVGLPGNFLALSYFIQTKKRNLPTLLYISACSIDILSSMIHLPVTINLFNGRKPGILKYRGFCSAWYLTLSLIQIMSVFVGMLISLTRALVIIFPFYRIGKKYVLISMILAFIYHSSWLSIFINVYGECTFSNALSYCEFSSDARIPTIYNLSTFTICLGVPPLLVLIALMASTAKLWSQNQVHASQANNRRSSITIIYFSVIYLVCNFLTFLNNALFIYSGISNTGHPDTSYPGPFYSNTFMFFYSWVLSEIFCTVLNASLNPILYLCRMNEMRMWVKKLISTISNS